MPLTERLARVRAKVAERGIGLRSSRSEEEVASFEDELGVRLPDEYRAFLLTVGDGHTPFWKGPGPGVGPPYYGLLSMRDSLTPEPSAAHPPPVRPREPFPLERAWVWEGDPDAAEERINSVFTDGLLYLGTDGCGMYWVLVVTGTERGHVWFVAEQGACPTVPPVDFLAWYEHWLNEGDLQQLLQSSG